MAQCKLSPQEYIKNSFTPQIAVVSSTSVNQMCLKNRLTFVELLRPFCKLSNDVLLQDASGGATTIRNLKVAITSINVRPPQPTLARKFLSTAVSQATETRYQTMQIGEYTLEIPAFTPWFESWRELFLQVQFPSDHEFTKHFLGSILAVSSADTNPLETMNHLCQNLSQIQNVVPNKLPKWFSSNTVRYYVIVHDNTEGDIDKATQALEAFKISFGISNCFLLRLNSRPPGQTDEQLPDPWCQYISNNFESSGSEKSSPEVSPVVSRLFMRSPDTGQEFISNGNTLPYHPLSPDTEIQKLTEMVEKELLENTQTHNTLHGLCLTTEDVEQIKILIHEFCTRALLPYVERQIQGLTDVVSNKKGVSKSLFSATKRWFTPNKAGASNGSASLPIYPPDAPELQMRKLADLYFMFSHYSMAFQLYHAAKRDFNSDQAWFYYAGALEMAALAAFMANESNRKTCDYMEEGIVTYLNVCKMAQFATRATLLSSECLKGRNLHGEAAHQLIRMTSEESDLRSALLLEQAAYCFLNCARPQMVRKYSFHMVLAGHRFSKAAQKKHALRCYKQALQVYHQKGWTFAEDHVQYTIGKLSSSLNILDEAASSFANLLTVQSKQTLEQQTLFLKEYLTMEKLLYQHKEQPPTLLLPYLKCEHVKVLVGPTTPLSVPGKVQALGISFNCEDTATTQKWIKLEEMVVHEAQGSLPLTFKPAVTLYTKENINSVKLTAIVSEPIQVSLQLYNPLTLPLYLKDMHLLWSFMDTSGNSVTNEIIDVKSNKFVQTHVIKSVTVQSNNSQEVVLVITPLAVGELLLEGIFYDLLSSGENVTDAVVVSGKQLFEFEGIGFVNKDTDVGVPISITPPAPCLQVSFSEISTEMLCNEIQQISMEMRNIGNGSLHKVYTSSSTPHLLSSCEFNDKYHQFSILENIDTPAVREREARKNHVTHIPLPNERLEMGQSYSVNMWLKAPSHKGPICVDLLIYYENCNSTIMPRYRLIRHVWNLSLHDSIEVNLAVADGYKSNSHQEIFFAVKAINLNKLYYSTLVEITLPSAGLLSQMWKLKYLENTKSSHPFMIQSQQSAYMLLRGRRHLSKSLKYYEVCLSSKTNLTTKPNEVYIDFAKRREQNNINIFEDPSISQTHHEKEGVLFFNWMAIICNASGDKRSAKGQSAIRIERLKANEDLESESRADAPIMIGGPKQCSEHGILEDGTTQELHTQISSCIIHTSHVYHNFKKQKLCIVPLKLALHNGSHVESIVTINTSKLNSAPTNLSKPNLFHPLPSKDYRWVGFSGTKKTVKAYSSEIIILHAAVSSPGVFDLSCRLEFWCQNELHEKPVLQVLQPQCFLTVKSEN